MSLLTKITQVEKLLAEIKAELSAEKVSIAEYEDAESFESNILLRIKGYWDSGVRSPYSATGTHFRCTDLLLALRTNEDHTLASILSSMVGKVRYDEIKRIGLALHKLSNQRFKHNGKWFVLDKYTVSSTSAYRFVETE